LTTNQNVRKGNACTRVSGAKLIFVANLSNKLYSIFLNKLISSKFYIKLGPFITVHVKNIFRHKLFFSICGHPNLYQSNPALQCSIDTENISVLFVRLGKKLYYHRIWEKYHSKKKWKIEARKIYNILALGLLTRKWLKPIFSDLVATIDFAFLIVAKHSHNGNYQSFQ